MSRKKQKQKQHQNLLTVIYWITSVTVSILLLYSCKEKDEDLQPQMLSGKKLLKEVYSDVESGKHKGEKVYEYDMEGRLLKETTTYAYPEFQRVVEYKYSSIGVTQRQKIRKRKKKGLWNYHPI